MARLVIDLPENSPGCIYSTGQVRLPASVGLGTAAAGLRLIRPKRMRTRVGMLRRRAKSPGTARGRRRTGPPSSPRPESGVRSVRRAPQLSRRNLSAQ